MHVHRKFINGVLVSHVIDGLLQPINEQPSSLPRPKPEWPLWAKALKKLAKPEDKGIGDVVARLIGDEKSAAFKAWHKATFGKDCGCAGRQTKWNRMYPLSSPKIKLPSEGASITN